MKKSLTLVVAALLAAVTLQSQAKDVNAYLLNTLGQRVDPASGGTTTSMVSVVSQPDKPQMDFKLAVSMGLYPGYSVIDKFGENPSITTATDPEDVWEYGGLYNYDANNTAPIQYLSSSDDDDSNVVTVQGLDIDGNAVSQDIALTGQTVANLTTPLWRVFRMINNGATSLEGMVYCHTDPTPTTGVPAGVAVRALIDDGNNQTLMSLYTIPLGKVGFLYRGELGIELEGNAAALAEYARIFYESRRYGGAFTVKKSVSLFPGNIHQDPRSFPDIIPALTDIKIKVTEVSADMGVWATFDILLVDEDLLDPALLAAIGQPTETF